MQIVIHRGTHQIGGCCTEIRTDRARIVIDFGDELPEPGQVSRPLELEGVSHGAPDCGGVFFTHYHGDHVGQLSRILPGIPLYMGGAAKEIFSLYRHRVAAHKPPVPPETLEAIRPLHPLGRVQVGDIRVTPLAVDHSAYDAYMFLMEAEGKRVLHTGDFRLHGFQGKGVLPALEKYVGQVDLLITEGTTLSRPGQNAVATERDLGRQAATLLQAHKYVFLVCSSTNIDRLAAFYFAAKRAGRLFLCNSYQKKVLAVVTGCSGQKVPLYDFSGALAYGRNLLPRMEEKGFCMLVQPDVRARRLMARFDPKQSLLIYSMWPGYLDRDPRLKAFVESQTWTTLHVSGHSAPEAIKAVCDIVRPRIGVIPIHTDAPQRMDQAVAPYSVIHLEDGSVYELR